MSQLFINLYLDEDVDMLIATLVRARGFKAITTQEAGRTGKGDEEQLAYAVSLRSTFFTHNRDDFERLAKKCFETGKKHHGIIAVRRQPYEIVRRLLIILNNTTADEMKNQLRYM